ncbi:Type 3 secretion system secretin [subsurface metagenome]
MVQKKKWVGMFFLISLLLLITGFCYSSEREKDYLDLFRKSEQFRERERLPEERKVEIDPEGKLIINFYKIDLREALNLIEEKAGVIIAVSEEVIGEVTIQLSDVSLEDALEAILSETNYTFKRVEEVYFVERKPAPPIPVVKLPPEQRLISNVFVDTDIREVLHTVAAQAEVNILVDDTVRGYITVDLKEVALEKTLRMILAPGGYTFVKMEDYYLVGSSDPRNPTFPKLSHTESIQLSYLDAEAASKLLSDFFEPYVKVDEKRNVLLISGSPEIINRIKQDIAKIDIPRKQVVIEALVTEIKREKGREFGLDWGWNWIPSQIAPEEQIEGIDVTGLQIGYTSRVVGEIFASLKALVKEGKAEIKSTPKISTLDGEEAEINVDREEYYVILAGPPEAPYYRFETITVGVSLRILPRIAGEDEIVMSITPQVSDVIQREETEFPVVSRRRVETTVRVRNGQTVIIGGLLQNIRRDIISGVPFLRKIPILDLFFSRKTTSEQQTELVVFITPQIVD